METSERSARRDFNRRKRTQMADSNRAMDHALHTMKLESSIRYYQPPSETVRRFIATKETITPEETARMESNVDSYLKILKEHCPPRESLISPRELRRNEIPTTLGCPWSARGAPRSPRQLTKLFDESPTFKSNTSHLQTDLPDIFITRSFQEFIERNGRQLPKGFTTVSRQPIFVPTSRKKRFA